MSGICGQFNLNRAPVAQADVRTMTAMLERRGPEHTGQWQDGPVGLGHTLLATTPELVFERQPFMHAETGCIITADVRLDNRDELLGSLSLSNRRESLGDAELILLAYLAWGERCLDRLLGDFAFAIWSPRDQTLFCARDHFGMRPLYYHDMPGRHFIFASDARAILALQQVPYQINDGRVADFLVAQLEWMDYTSTFYQGINRLPPGHKVVVTPAGTDVEEYWQPAPGPHLGFTTDDDYEQGLLEVLGRAVDARLRAPLGTVGSMFSGGMDSGSVVAIGKELLSARGDGPLHTFSAARHRDADCAESRAIYAAISLPSILPTLIHPDQLDDVYAQYVLGSEEPFDGQFMILKAIFRAARDNGRRVVLDGGGGDVILAEGTYVTRLLRQGKFKLAMKEIAAENRFWEEGSIAASLYRHTRAAFVPEIIKKSLRKMSYRHGIDKNLEDSLISREFASNVDIEDRFEQMQQPFAGGWSADYAHERCYAIRPSVTAGRERYARIAAALGAEARDPFMDKRVVDYCTRLPGRFRLKNGWPKMILRKIMADKLPQEVLWCRGKPHLGWLFNETITKQAIDQGALNITELQESLAGYVDSQALTSAWQSFREGGDGDQLHTACLLSVWLREAAQRPVVPDQLFI